VEGALALAIINRYYSIDYAEEGVRNSLALEVKKFLSSLPIVIKLGFLASG